MPDASPRTRHSTPTPPPIAGPAPPRLATRAPPAHFPAANQGSGSVHDVFRRWKALAIIGVCLSRPDLGPEPAAARQPAGWARQISLGLDLRGGSYLLLEVDTSAIVRERLEALVDSARRGTAQANPRILYTGLAANPAERRVSLRVSDPARAPDVARILREAAIAVNAGGGAQQPDIEVTSTPDGTVTATLTEVALRSKAGSAVEQSLEIVRRRVDESGLVESVIARQGQNRILVQLPGVEDPARIKDLLGRTARMTFHLLDEAATCRPRRHRPGRCSCRATAARNATPCAPGRGRRRQPDRCAAPARTARRRMGGELHLRQRRHPPLRRDHAAECRPSPSPSSSTSG
jgi:preprotein translocase subunit SecD